MPYIPYTDEQKQLANSMDLPIFLRMRGEKLVPVGREFKLVYSRIHGSLGYLNTVEFKALSLAK
jgi:hypothetical protein